MRNAVLTCLIAPVAVMLAAPATAASDSHSALEKKNIAVALGYIDVVWNKHDPVAGFARYVSPTSVHHPGKPGGENPAGMAKFLTGFPDFKYNVKHVYADGDFVITHSELTGVPGIGTPVAGLPGAKPASKVGDEVVDIFRVKDGKITEHWDTVEPIGGTSDGVF